MQSEANEKGWEDVTQTNINPKTTEGVWVGLASPRFNLGLACHDATHRVAYNVAT